LKFYKDDIKFKGNRDQEEKKMVFNIKPTTLLIHVLNHRIEDIEVFQMPQQKAVLNNEMTLYVYDARAIYSLIASTNNFLIIFNIYTNYNNTTQQLSKLTILCSILNG
jgi:hypothetical protein